MVFTTQSAFDLSPICIAATRGQRLGACCAFVLMCAMLSSPGLSQEPELRKSRGPYYVGDPVQMQVSVVLEEEPGSIDCIYEGDVDGIQVTGPQQSIQSVGSSISINGRLIQKSQMNYAFLFRVLADKEGPVVVGPFKLTIDGREQIIKGTQFDFETLEPDDGMSLKLEVADEQIYVGQRVPVQITWTFEGDKYARQLAAGRLVVRSSLFDQFEFEDEGGRTTDTMVIETADRAFEVIAKKSDVETINSGRVTLTAERTLLAQSPGEFDGVVASCRTIRGSDWGRSFFDIVPQTRKPAVAISEPISFRILPLPTEGRPSSFTGAVGNGYSIDVSANRSVLRVGDPISLDVTVRGDGNLKDLTVPMKTGTGVLDDTLFQLPKEVPPGSFSGSAKQFKIPLRVKSESVNQIPAIEFSWFDPVTETYEKTFSKPIALQVLEAQVVSAADVVAASTTKQQPSDVQSEAPKRSSASELSFLGANLAIETDASRLLPGPSWFSSTWMRWLLYASGALAILVGLAARVAANRDPSAVQQSSRWQEIRNDIREARRLADQGDDPKSSLETVASAIRGVLPELSASQRSELESVLSDCENQLFAPQGTSAERARQLCDRADMATQRLAKEVASS